MFTFDEIKEKAVPIAVKHGVDSISLFGSYARNGNNSGGDKYCNLSTGHLCIYKKIKI